MPSPNVPTPSPTPMDTSLTSSLMAMVQSDQFLATINGLIADQLPEKINAEFVRYSDKLSLGLNYKAQLLECTGLNTLAITEFGQGLADMVKRDGSGDMMVSLGAVLGIQGITCSGSASLDAMGVRAKADPFQATMNVQNLAPKLIGKIARKDGKTCLSVSDVELEIRRDMVSWKDVQVNFTGPSIPVPTLLTDLATHLAWDNLPIDGLISSMNSMIVETLKTQLNNMGAEQCFALSPTVALTQSPIVIPTAAPTLISTGAPMPSPNVPTPSPTPMDTSLTSSLMAMVQSDQFLATINGLIADQLPEKINAEIVRYSDKLSLGLNYKAQLLECTGLNTLAITEFGQGLADMVKRDGSGDMMVSLGAVLGIQGITCSGSASLDAMGVRAKADPFQATMNVQNLAPKIIGKIAPKDGKTCLSVSDVELEIRRDMVSWK